MGCGCKQGNKILEGVNSVQNHSYTNNTEDMQANRGVINNNLCAVSLSELQDLMYKTRSVLSVTQHSEIEKGQALVQKWFENYGFECPDRKQFNDFKKLVEDEYAKYNT